MLLTRPIFDYDPRRHITARQLRSLGFLLCENIPDEAYVRRYAVGLASDPLEDGSPSLRLDVLESFNYADEDAACCV